MSPPPDFTFRYATKADAPALHALIEHAYRGAETAGRWDSESHILKGPRTTLDFVADRITGPDSRFVIAEEADELRGCAMIEKPAPGRTAAYFGMFAIDTSIRSKGLGRAVVAACERFVRDLWDAQAMEMSVISLRTELMGWYERQGYELTGERQPFPFSETTGEVRRDFDLVTMRKDF